MKKIIFSTANGVVAQSANKKVISVINCDGKKQLKSLKTKNKVIFWHFPFARGVQYFFCGMIGFVQALANSIELCQPKIVKEKDLRKYYYTKLFEILLICALSIIFSALFLGYFPGTLTNIIVDEKQNVMFRNGILALFKIILIYFIFLCIRVFPTIREMFRFNYASEMALNDDFKKKGENIKKKLINPLNFLNFLIFVFILDTIVLTLIGAGYGFWFNILFHIALLILSASIGYEILLLLSKCNFLRSICYITAILVIAKPTKTHVDTVAVALAELNLLCSQKDREYMDENKKAFSLVYNEVRNKLSVAGITDKSEADWLVATVLGKNRAEIKLVPYVTDKQEQDILRATQRRAKGESLDNIFGWTEFFGLRFDVNKKVLTPRMETEILVEQVLKAQKNYKNPTILDVGTGSGAIAIAIKKNCEATVTAVDISKTALLTAQNNAKKLNVNVEFIQSNLFESLKKRRKFDIIVSNPPYIPSKDIEKLDKNVRECDPTLALDGGEDGLDFYREITAKATSRLNANGMLFYEVGKGQASSVRKLMRENGFEEIKTIKDYNKIERIVCGKLR